MWTAWSRRRCAAADRRLCCGDVVAAAPSVTASQRRRHDGAGDSDGGWSCRVRRARGLHLHIVRRRAISSWWLGRAACAVSIVGAVSGHGLYFHMRCSSSRHTRPPRCAWASASNGFALAISSCKLTLFVVIQVYMFKLPRHLKLADIVRRYSGANWFLYMLLFWAD